MQRRFPRYSFDLIYALPDQTLKIWEKQLSHALGFADKHLSLYQLTFEQGTRFYQWMKSGRIVPLDDDLSADLYDMTVARMSDRGLSLYEISNFAAPGEECRHNMVYWTGGDWIGVGPGGHGRIGRAPNRLATTEWRSPEKWLIQVEGNTIGCETAVVLDQTETAEELVLTGLRLDQGIQRTQFQRVTGLQLDSTLNPEKIKELAKNGLAQDDGDRLRLTDTGRQVLDSAMKFLLTE